MPNLTKQQHIQAGLAALLEKKHLSQNELARMTDVSAANISHMLNGREDKAISEEIWNRAAVPLGDLGELELLKTSGFNTIVRNCETTQADHLLTCVLGGPGYGKTAALRRYFQTTPNVYYVEFWYSMSRREFFLAVARALAVDLGKRPTLAYLIQRCADKLNSATGSLLIIDEASTMQPEKLNYVRELRERTQNNAGILLAGAPYFRDRLTRYTARERDGVPELMSRMSLVAELPTPTKKELLAVARANGVNAADAQAALNGGALPEYRRLKHWLKQYRPTEAATA